MSEPIADGKLRVLALAALNAAPGDWWTDKETNEADPSWDVPVLFVGDKRLLDAHSSEHVLLREEHGGDESGDWHDIWDETSSVVLEFIAEAQPARILQLLALKATAQRTLEEYRKSLSLTEAACREANVRADQAVAALKGLIAIRPENWDDEEDPEQVAAWTAADLATAHAGAGQ